MSLEYEQKEGIINKSVNKDTKIEIVSKKESEEVEEEEKQGVKEIEKMMKELTMGKESTDGKSEMKVFGGYKQQIELIREVIGLKLINKDT